MTARPLVLLCAIAMLASLFLPWVAGPLGADMVPWNGLKQLDTSQIDEILSDLPPEGMAFFGSFVLAALLVLLGLMGSAPRLIVFVTGAIPVGLIAWAIFQSMQEGQSSPLPISGGDISQIMQELLDYVGPGAWAWVGGGALLLLLGLFAPNRR